MPLIGIAIVFSVRLLASVRCREVNYIPGSLNLMTITWILNTAQSMDLRSKAKKGFLGDYRGNVVSAFSGICGCPPVFQVLRPHRFETLQQRRTIISLRMP